MKNRKGASLIIIAFSIFALLGLASFALDLGIILNQRYELQKAVETAALISASEYEIYETLTDVNIPTSAQITSGNANAHYQALLNTNQLIEGLTAVPAISLNMRSKAVRILLSADVSTYFLKAIRVNQIKITANAAAVNMPVFLSNKLPKPTGSILRGTGTYNDTDIRQPLGSVAASTTTVSNQNVSFTNILGQPDGKVLSLGPGGYITIKLPATLVDGKGVDFAIYERGHAEGYFVYAGIDNDAADPYADASAPGGGIHWVNISCTGIPVNVKKNEIIGTHSTTVPINGANITDYKFYGSGLFDLSARCTDISGTVIYDGTGATAGAARLSNVKYIKIVDDNRENGFFIQSRFGIAEPAAIPTLIPGEHSTFTPGADLDSVAIFHHSRLIRTSDFSTNSDADNVIDIVENMYGLNPAAADSDGDGIGDLEELWGYDPAATTMTVLNGPLPVIFKDYPTWAEPPPVMEIVP